MHIDDYQTVAQSYAFYPNSGNEGGELYPVLGLNGEAGEVAEKFKKAMRDGVPDDFTEQVKKELGDCLWYISAIASEMGLKLSAVAQGNLHKLQGRSERGVLSGSGDER